MLVNVGFLFLSPRPPWKRWGFPWICLFLATLSLLASRPVWAQEPAKKGAVCAAHGAKTHRVRVTLDAKESQDTPSHACVVSLQQVETALSLAEVAKPKQAGDTSPSELAKIQMGDQRWKDAFANWGKAGMTEATQIAGDIEQAKKGWPDFKDRVDRRCATHAGALDICQPHFGLPRHEEERAALGHYMQCVGNSQPADAETRVVVIFVNAHATGRTVAEQPLICDLRLDVNILSFNMEDAEIDGSRVLANVLGGDYAESSSIAFKKGEVQLPLERRCQPHDILLPANSATGNAKVTLFLSRPDTDENVRGARVAECDAPIVPNGHFEMTLPYLRTSERRRLEVSVGRPELYTYARYEGSWFEFKPPVTLSVRQAAISFRWKRHCLYPAETNDSTPCLACPEVTLLDAGVGCKGAPVGEEMLECGYLCDPRPPEQADTSPEPLHACSETSPTPASNSEEKAPEVLFDLPQAVRFRRPRAPEDQWTDRLVSGGQILSGYVPLEERFVDVDMSAWTERTSFAEVRSRAAAKITRIRFRGPNGDLHYIHLPANGEEVPSLRLALPGAQCDATVTYQIEGERPHKEESISLKDGRLFLPHPEDTEQVLAPSLSTGVSFILLNLRSDLSNLDVPTEPLGIVGAALAFRPKGWPMLVEARYSFLFGPQGYLRLRTQTERDAQPTSVFYTRHVVELAPMWTPQREVRFGGSLGLLLGAPLLDVDRGRVGNFDAAFTTALLLQYLPVPNWSVEAAVRLIWGEPIYEFRSNFVDAPTYTEVSNVRGAVELRLRYTYE